MSSDEFSKAQGKAQAEKAKKVSKGEIVSDFARSIHPVSISTNGCMRSLPKFPNDLRFVKMGESLKYVQHLGDGVLIPITMEDAASAFACSLGNLCIDYGSKDFMEMAKLAKLSAKMYEDDAIKKCEYMKTISVDVQFLPLIIEENEVVPVREKSDWGWCWKRLDFDADPNGDPGAWLSEVKPRVKTNWHSFCAFIGSLFDPNSSRERYVWLYGGGESGKSTICDAIQEVFGNSSVSRDASKIKEKWFTASILGKRLVVLNEASPKTVNSGTWKSLTGEDHHECEDKGEKIYTARIDAKFVITSNDYPDVASGEEHSRRIILVETEKPDDWVPTNENTKARTLQRLKDGWPWFLDYCKQEYEKNPRLVPETMETVHELQGEDENAEKFHELFVKDKAGIVTYKDLKKALPDWERYRLRKFIAYCIKVPKVVRDRNPHLKFFRGMRIRSPFDSVTDDSTDDWTEF